MENISKLVRHIVIFKYRDGSSVDQIQQVTDAFRELQHQIPGIHSFEHGINNSPEGKNLGFTHVYTLLFDDIQARDAYFPIHSIRNLARYSRASISSQMFLFSIMSHPRD